MKIVLCTLLCLSLASCWWEVGHMMTAQVARNHMQQDHPEALKWAESLIQDLNPLTDGRTNTFVEAAVWADDIKEPGTNYMDNWHFTDKPVNQDGLLIHIADTDVQFNAMLGIGRAEQILTNPKTANQRHTLWKAQMLRYILHIVGDIHQPLHDSNFYNATYWTGDLGGNRQKVQLRNGTIVNLHMYWDSGAFLLQPSDDFLVRPLNQSAHHYMEQWGNRMMTAYPFELFEDEDMTNPEVWTMTGYNQAVEYVYPFFKNTNQINADYEKQSFEIVQRNIVLGGYRLAHKLVQIFEQIQKNELEGFVQSKLRETIQRF